MASAWERHLGRWVAASLIDTETAGRIRVFEAERERGGGLRWPVLVAVALGALLLGAGVFLFVSAHWDGLSPAARMILVVLLVGVFHIGGAVAAERWGVLALALHAVGTLALGAGIALAGQIFHLSAHWPAGIMLWAGGALAAWLILRQWPQAAISAVLIPYWLCGEWWEAMSGSDYEPALCGLFLLAGAYMAASTGEGSSPVRRALVWIGGIAILPSGAALLGTRWAHKLSWDFQAVGAWALALGLPLGLAYLLRGRGALVNGAWAVWALVIYLVKLGNYQGHLFEYAWAALGSVGLIAWGVREQRVERINLGMLGFALAVLAYYFSSVMDKLGRSASLIGLGVLFLAGGWALERLRRRLIAQVQS